MRVKRFSLRALTPQPATVSILLLHGSGTDWLTRQSLQFTRFPFFIRAQELCESRGGRPGLTVPNSPYSLCGRKAILKNRAPELCESRGGRPGLTVSNSPYSLCGRKAILKNRAPELCESRGGRPGLTVPNSLCGRKAILTNRAPELCESRGGRPGLTVPNSLCGRKAILKNRAPELCESRGGRPGLTVPNAPYGLCGLKATLNLNFQQPLRCDSLSPLRFLSGTGRNTNGFSAMLNTVVKTSSLSSWFHLALINPDWAQGTN